jgi:hypothetical protein
MQTNNKCIPSETIKSITRFLFIGEEIDDLPQKIDLAIVLGNNDIVGTIKLVKDLFVRDILQESSTIVFSGNVGALSDSTIPEAIRLKQEADNQKMIFKDLIIESKATNTKENFEFSKKLIEEKTVINNYEKILVIGKAFLLRRAKMSASASGYPMSKMHFIGTVDPHARNIGPDTWYLQDVSVKRVLEEIQRIAQYTLKGDLSIF